jgi:hypothetical protein
MDHFATVVGDRVSRSLRANSPSTSKMSTRIARSYSTYAYMGQAAADAGGPDKAYRDYIAENMIGTPEELVEHHRIRKEMVGDYEMLANFSWGGMPHELVYAQLKLFADKVLPDLKGWREFIDARPSARRSSSRGGSSL